MTFLQVIDNRIAKKQLEKVARFSGGNPCIYADVNKLSGDPNPKLRRASTVGADARKLDRVCRHSKVSSVVASTKYITVASVAGDYRVNGDAHVGGVH